eukprot:CCRYP_012971-RA/>CCRYP_012971-RA protein AED:0.03 eAED:0.02 QI:237/0.66/0.75/1/1/1/4/104/1158
MGDYHLQQDDKSSSTWGIRNINFTPRSLLARSNSAAHGDISGDKAARSHRRASTAANMDLELPVLKTNLSFIHNNNNNNNNNNARADLLSPKAQESLVNLMSTAPRESVVIDKVVIDVLGADGHNNNNNHTGNNSSSNNNKYASQRIEPSDSVTFDFDSQTSLSAASKDKKSRSSRPHKTKKKSKSAKRGNSASLDEEKLDTYNGVFLPCLAQIVGVIFFLRLPTITGQAGTIGTSLIVMICVISTFITSLSLSAIASNGTIQAGGPYYIISRTLGVEIGGALGMLFYLGTTLGASMHVMGAVETLAHRKKYAYSTHSIAGIGRFLDSCPQQVWSLLLMFTIARIVSVGSKYVNGAANFFLLAVGLSIVSIMTGTILFAFGLYDGSLSDEERAFNDNLFPNYSPDPKTGLTPTFWNLLSIFYPATTGILAGTNRSSKLATPNQSIPIGTIGAIAVTTVLYLFQVWLIGSVVNHETLIFNKLVLASVAFPSQLMAKVGMVTSCIGAALQCMAGAPQLLGAIAADGAIPFLKFLTRKKRSRGELRSSPKSRSMLGLTLSTSFNTNTNNDDAQSIASEKSADVEYENSKRAVWFTWAIASLGTLLGNIDRITPILTMFYLMMYGGINLCCFLLAWVDSPGFRPQFKYFSRKTALFGFFWCSLLDVTVRHIAFMISWLMALIAAALLFIIFKYIALSAEQSSSRSKTNSKTIDTATNWGDVFDSVRYKITTAILARVTGTENFHAKNWRPQLLTVVDTDEDGKVLNMEVIALAAQFKGGRGLNMVVSVKPGSFLHKGTFETSQHCNETLKKCMETERLKGFSEVIMTKSNYAEAVWAAVLHSGLGPVSPNTVLLGWLSDWRQRVKRDTTVPKDDSSFSESQGLSACTVDEFVDALKGLGNMQRAVCILKGTRFPRHGDVMPPGSTIDIYWVVDDGGLCLLLSYIISRNPIWRRDVRLRVFAMTTVNGCNHEDLEIVVTDFLQQIRINASVKIVTVQEAELADDFLAHNCVGCPKGSPKLTIQDKFHGNKGDDDISNASSASDGQLFGGGKKACLPNLVAAAVERRDDLRDCAKESKHCYVAFTGTTHPSLNHDVLSLEMAKKFNKIIRQESPYASMVVTHLPLPHKAVSSNKFMEYVDALVENIDNMLLIQGTGVEYLTTVA